MHVVTLYSLYDFFQQPSFKQQCVCKLLQTMNCFDSLSSYKSVKLTYLPVHFSTTGTDTSFLSMLVYSHNHSFQSFQFYFLQLKVKIQTLYNSLMYGDNVILKHDHQEVKCNCKNYCNTIDNNIGVCLSIQSCSCSKTLTLSQSMM